MKRLLPFAILLVAAVAALAWWMTREGGAPPSEAGPDERLARPAAPDDAPELVAAADPQEAEPDEPAAVESTQDRRREAGLRDFDPALARKLEGRVEIPPGTPADEQLEVVAIESRRAPSPRAEALAELDPERVLARADVGLDGSFHLALPPDSGEAWVVLRSRYLRAASAVHVPEGRGAEPLSIVTELGGWITGRLALPRDAQAGEIDREETAIELVPDPMASLGAGGTRARPREQQREVRLDERLVFECTGVAGGVPLDLRARPDTFAAVKSETFDLRPGEHREVELALTRGGRLVGTVRDDAGRPVEGAELAAEIDPVMMGLGGYVVREGKSGADGTFALEAVAAGKLVVRTSAEGLLDARSEAELSEGATRAGIEIVLERGSSIAGVVRWPDGAPGADLDVNVDFDPAALGGMGALNAMRGASGKGHTDEAGAFLVSGLGKGPFVVSARAKREGADWRARSASVRPDTQDLELELQAPVGLAGRVVDEAGQPVSAFRVAARTRTTGMFPGLGGESRSQTFGDENGEFLLEGLTPGAWIVLATGEGYGRGDELEVELPALAPVELRLPHAAAVSGRVLSPEGLPVQGATVEQDLSLQGLIASGQGGRDAPSALSDVEGNFTLEGLTPGSISVLARREGFAKSVPVPVDLAPSQRVSDVVLELRRGGRILGEVYGKDGDPLVGVTIIAQQPSDLSGQRFATADGEGSFVFEGVNPGSWQVLTMPGGGALEELDPDDFGAFFADMKMAMVEVAEGQDVHVVLGAPPANPVLVKGLVVVEDEPQAGAIVTFFLDGAEGMQGLKFTSVDKQGRFTLDLDRPGRYVAQVQRVTGGMGQQQSVQLRVEVPDERELDLVLRLPVGQISGLVRGADGRPLEGARISLTADGAVSNLTFMGGQFAEIATDADGRYQLTWLRAGSYTVAAGGPSMVGAMFGGEESPAGGREVKSGVRVGEDEHVAGVDFRLREPGRLKGLVRDAGGRPVEGAAVFLRDEQGELLERISMVMSDASGRFSYPGLAPGRYHVHVRSGELVSPAHTSVTIRAGEDSEVALAVGQGTILLVLLSDREGNLVDCELAVRDEEGRQVNGSWSLSDLMAMASSGSFSSKEQRIGPLPPGRYVVEATGPDGKTSSKPVTLSGQSERKLNLRL